MKQALSLLVLKYLRFFARLQLRKNKPLIVGITGTAGKTSTLNAVYAALKDYRQVKASFGANSESGIPLNILGLKSESYSPSEWLKLMLLAPFKLLTNWEKFDTYVAEMAIDSPDEPKNMDYLLTILRPHIGIFLNVRPLHSQQFDHLVESDNPEDRLAEVAALIAKEKGKMIVSLPGTGTAILNIDDQLVKACGEKTAAALLTVSAKSQADYEVIKVSQTIEGTSFSLKYQGKTYKLNFPGLALPAHFGQTFASALAAANATGISIKKAIRSIERNFSLPPGRASLIPAVNGAFILDSSYNSSADATIDALNLLKTISPRKKVALLGDLRELGLEAEPEHQRVARVAAKNCDLVVLVGPEMIKYALPVLEQNGTPTEWYANAYQAADYLQERLKKNDVLLVKGSQNTLLLEIAVEKLMKNPADADRLLCRRGAFWDKKRRELKSN